MPLWRMATQPRAALSGIRVGDRGVTDPTPAALPRIGVIMPAYNEAERIEQTLGSVARYLADGGNVSRVYLADDGSTDRTIEIAEGEAARLALSLEVLRLPH